MATKLDTSKKSPEKKSCDEGVAFTLRQVVKGQKAIKAVLLKIAGPKAIAEAEKEHGVDIDGDGKLGSVRVGVLVALLGMFVVAGFAGAVTIQKFKDTDTSRTTIWTLSGDGDGTATVALTGDLTVSGNVTSSGTATNSGDLVVSGDLSVLDSATVATNLTVSGAVTNSSTLAQVGAATLSGALTVVGATSLTNTTYIGNALTWKNFTIDANLVNTITALGVVTNGGIITANGNVLTASAGGLATNTIANSAIAGRTIEIICLTAGPLVIVDGGNLSMSGAFTGAANDSITFRAISTSAWVETSRSDN